MFREVLCLQLETRMTATTPRVGYPHSPYRSPPMALPFDRKLLIYQVLHQSRNILRSGFRSSVPFAPGCSLAHENRGLPPHKPFGPKGAPLSPLVTGARLQRGNARMPRTVARLFRGSARFPAAGAQMPVTYGHRSRMHIWNAIPHVCSAVLHICPPRMHICGSHMGSCRGHVVTGHVVSGHVVAVTSSPAVAQVPRPYCSPPASANSAGASSAWKARSCLGA